MQTVVGIICIALGCMHFADRDRATHSRSFYVGGLKMSPRFRTGLAIIEVLCGFVLLFTA